jgi:hypothetical protein
MRLTKVISTAIVKGRLIIKVLGFGSKDVQTVSSVQPFGIDSNPIDGYRGIWARTESAENRILLGILFERATAQPGELRLYAENDGGTEVYSIHIKKNGTCEIGGNADNAVRFQKLDDELQSFKSKINTELSKIQTGITGVGGTYLKTDTTIDISQAKINNIKTS